MTWARLLTNRLPSTLTPVARSASTSFMKANGIEHHAVADDAAAAFAQHAAGNQLQDELLAVDGDGVSGVVSAGIARHDLEALGEHVNDLAFALVAPLGADDHCCLACSSTCCSRRERPHGFDITPPISHTTRLSQQGTSLKFWEVMRETGAV